MRKTAVRLVIIAAIVFFWRDEVGQFWMRYCYYQVYDVLPLSLRPLWEPLELDVGSYQVEREEKRPTRVRPPNEAYQDFTRTPSAHSVSVSCPEAVKYRQQALHALGNGDTGLYAAQGELMNEALRRCGIIAQANQ